MSSSTSATASARVAAAAASLLAPVYQAGQPGDGTVSTFVTNLYRELLGRAPDNAGDAYWTNLLNAASGSGSSMPSTAMRNQVASGFLNSPEFEEHFVTGVYKDFLGRSPDQAGMQYFANQLSNTQSLAHVVADVVGSKEFYVNQGGTPQGFVSALYRDLLGRNGNAGDTAYWANQVADGSDSASLSRVALAFLETPEAQQKLLDGNYQAPAGGTPLVAAGQVSAGAYPLAETTGNGFGVLYLQADVESADKSAFFSQMNAASLDFAALEALLSSNQFFSGSSSGSQSTDASFLSGIAADSQRNALLGMIATQLASSTKVAQFGQTIANDQARTIIDVAPVLQVEQLQLPQFSQQDAQTLQNLGALTGTAFDQQFLQFIVQQEQQEVGSLQQEISAGSDTAVRDLASQLLPIFQADLATAQGLTASTGGSTSSLTSSSSSPSSGSTQSNSSSQSGSSASDTQATDAAFLNFAVSGDERETILGLLAEQLAETPAVAAFGQRLAVDHTMTMLSSLPALKASGVQMPPMTPAEEQVIAQYAALAGEGFDSPFGPFMVDDHESDVTHFQNETVTAVNPATAQAAMAALPILQDHLQIAQQLSQLESSGDDGESGS